MKKLSIIVLAGAAMAVSLILAGCSARVEADPKLGEPPPADVIQEGDGSTFLIFRAIFR